MSHELNEPTKNLNTSQLPAERRLRILTIVNLAMLAAIVILFVLFFTSRGGADTQAAANDTSEVKPVESLKIAYINNEELTANYKLWQKLETDLEEEQKRLEADLNRRQQGFQNEYEKAMSDAQSGAVSAEVLQAKEQDLIKRQQDLMQLRDTYYSRIAKKERDIAEEISSVLRDFFERYNLTRGYDYILMYGSRLSLMYYANDKHDITQEVLELLNADYESNQ